jgi:hypothetical protein
MKLNITVPQFFGLSAIADLGAAIGFLIAGNLFGETAAYVSAFIFGLFGILSISLTAMISDNITNEEKKEK